MRRLEQVPHWFPRPGQGGTLVIGASNVAVFCNIKTRFPALQIPSLNGIYPSRLCCRCWWSCPWRGPSTHGSAVRPTSATEGPCPGRPPSISTVMPGPCNRCERLRNTLRWLEGYVSHVTHMYHKPNGNRLPRVAAGLSHRMQPAVVRGAPAAPPGELAQRVKQRPGSRLHRHPAAAGLYPKSRHAVGILATVGPSARQAEAGLTPWLLYSYGPCSGVQFTRYWVSWSSNDMELPPVPTQQVAPGIYHDCRACATLRAAGALLPAAAAPHVGHTLLVPLRHQRQHQPPAQRLHAGAAGPGVQGGRNPSRDWPLLDVVAQLLARTSRVLALGIPLLRNRSARNIWADPRASYSTLVP